MSFNSHADTDIINKADLEDAYRELREQAGQAQTKEELMRLYQRAGSPIDLLNVPAAKQKFGKELAGMQKFAKDQFTITARKINRQAKKIGLETNFQETWHR